MYSWRSYADLVGPRAGTGHLACARDVARCPNVQAQTSPRPPGRLGDGLRGWDLALMPRLPVPVYVKAARIIDALAVTVALTAG